MHLLDKLIKATGSSRHSHQALKCLEAWDVQFFMVIRVHEILVLINFMYYDLTMTTRTHSVAKSKAKNIAPSGKANSTLLSDQIRAFKRRYSKLKSAPTKTVSVTTLTGAEIAAGRVRVSTTRDPEAKRPAWPGRIRHLKLRLKKDILHTGLLAKKDKVTSQHAYVIITELDLEKLIVSRIKEQIPRLIEGAQQQTDPFGAARARGDAYKRTELAKPENMTLAEAARRLNCSDAWLNTLRKRNEFYALVEAGRERGFRYPSWQFDVSRERMSAVLQALHNVHVDGWGIHAFFNAQTAELAGRTPREAILDTAVPVDDILKVVNRRYAVDQGAQ